MDKNYDGNCTKCGAEGFDWVVKEPNKDMQLICNDCKETTKK